jgi:hypothetical protein
MTEIVEYSLVVVVSALFVTGSVVVFNSFSSFESGLQLRATFAAISGVALQAVDSGSAKATMSIPASTIWCEHDSLTMSTGSATVAGDLPIDCNFSLNVGGGLHTLLFTRHSTLLSLSVS